IKNRHAHSEAVGDLIENHALSAVSNFAVDLDATIDRARMHDETIGLENLRALFGESEKRGVLTDSGKIFFALTFVLNAQKIHYVHFRQHFIDRVRNGDAKLFEFPRHECAWSNQRDASAQLEETKNIRARDAAEQNVTDNRHV